MSGKLWEQRGDESSLAFEAFRLYLSLKQPRKLSALIPLWKRRNPNVKSGAILRRWMTEYAWAERAEAWDRHIQSRALDAQKRRALRAKEKMIQALFMGIERVAINERRLLKDMKKNKEAMYGVRDSRELLRDLGNQLRQLLGPAYSAAERSVLTAGDPATELVGTVLRHMAERRKSGDAAAPEEQPQLVRDLAAAAESDDPEKNVAKVLRDAAKQAMQQQKAVH